MADPALDHNAVEVKIDVEAVVYGVRAVVLYGPADQGDIVHRQLGVASSTRLVRDYQGGIPS